MKSGHGSTAKYLLIPLAIVLFLAIYPQINIWSVKGGDWHGAYVVSNYDEVAYSDPAVLIFGCESVGLPAEIRERHADATVSIPMRDPMLRSLNLSTAVAIGGYEVRRQWSRSGQG